MSDLLQDSSLGSRQIMTRVDLEDINKMIEGIEKRAKGLIEKGQGIQAIERNAARILASTKMLKINVSDLVS